MKRARKLLLFAMMAVLCLPVVKADAAEKVYNSRTINADTFGDDGRFVKILYIGPDVVEIDANAASALPRLQKIVVDSDNLYFASFDGCLYDKNKTKLLYMPPKSTSHWYPVSMSSFTASSMANTNGGQTNAVEAVIRDNVEVRKMIAEENKAEAERKKAEADRKKEEAEKKKEEQDARKKAKDDEYKKNTCLIAFDPDGGSGKMAEVRATKDVPYRLPECTLTPPKKMRFSGWRMGPEPEDEEEEGPEIIKPGSYYTFSDDTAIIYAVWKSIR